MIILTCQTLCIVFIHSVLTGFIDNLVAELRKYQKCNKWFLDHHKTRRSNFISKHCENLPPPLYSIKEYLWQEFGSVAWSRKFSWGGQPSLVGGQHQSFLSRKLSAIFYLQSSFVFWLLISCKLTSNIIIIEIKLWRPHVFWWISAFLGDFATLR